MPPEEGMRPHILLQAAMQSLGGVGLEQAVQRQRRQRRALQQLQSGTEFNMLAVQVTSDDISSCTQLIACNATWNETQSRGVVALYVMQVTTLSITLCSGSILNAPESRTFFLLTADHCFANKSEVNNFENWVLAFNYKTSSCIPNSARPMMTQTMQGVSLQFYQRRVDVLILQILGGVSDYFQTYALGYDARPDYIPESVVGIHHPGGDVQHISFAIGPGAVSTNFTASPFPPGKSSPATPPTSR
eukprot:jgi/Botrbrau1/4736/Bobra.0137s0008.1